MTLIAYLRWGGGGGGVGGVDERVQGRCVFYAASCNRMDGKETDDTKARTDVRCKATLATAGDLTAPVQKTLILQPCFDEQ
jgi:hypothetical protein